MRFYWHHDHYVKDVQRVAHLHGLVYKNHRPYLCHMLTHEADAYIDKHGEAEYIVLVGLIKAVLSPKGTFDTVYEYPQQRKTK